MSSRGGFLFPPATLLLYVLYEDIEQIELKLKCDVQYAQQLEMTIDIKSCQK